MLLRLQLLDNLTPLVGLLLQAVEVEVELAEDGLDVLKVLPPGSRPTAFVSSPESGTGSWRRSIPLQGYGPFFLHGPAVDVGPAINVLYVV